jgi:hypothetical protein
MKEEINELKKLIEEAESFHKASLDESLSDDEADTAYGEYWSRLEKIADVLCSVTGGKIDRNTGLKMAAHKSSQILDLAKRVA